MWRRLMLAGVLAFLAALGAVPVEAAASGARIQTGTFIFSTTTPCVFFTDVGFVVCGTGGTVDYRLVFTPSGENSWFKVQDFTGAVFQCTNPSCLPLASLVPLMSFADGSAMVLVHLGPNRPNFILVNHPSTPLPHQIPLP